MTKQIILFLDVLITGLISGVIFGIWIGYNPQDLSAQTYVEQQQNVIRALNTLMPILGLVAIILTITSAIFQKLNTPVFITLLIAAGLLIISGLVTRFGNQPLNAIVMTWSLNDIPENWTVLRDKWWTFHIIRTVSSIIAFSLIIWTVIRNQNLARLHNRVDGPTTACK
ncbi:MAG: DUF1772 domain-containing protein [Daejeonella sp.]